MNISIKIDLCPSITPFVCPFVRLSAAYPSVCSSFYWFDGDETFQRYGSYAQDDSYHRLRLVGTLFVWSVVQKKSPECKSTAVALQSIPYASILIGIIGKARFMCNLHHRTMRQHFLSTFRVTQGHIIKTAVCILYRVSVPFEGYYFRTQRSTSPKNFCFNVRPDSRHSYCILKGC